VPLLVSTGMANLAEVESAVEVIGGSGAPPVALLHCVTSYPSAPEDSNLRAIETLRASFGVPTGYSDHTQGIHVSLAAVAVGASVIEKHFTIDRALPGPDHKASLEPQELNALVRGIRDIEASMGDGQKQPRQKELPLIAAARRSLHAVRDLAVGHVLVASDLIALRPGTGISPARLGEVVGRRLGKAVALGELLAEDHLE
jgi:N-acetylneuraminate synthase/N,N'-diacetyllegionaminate synthase